MKAGLDWEVEDGEESDGMSASRASEFAVRPPGVPPMTREVCSICFAPYMKSFATASTICCGCALGFAPGKAPSWEALGGRPEKDRTGGPGYRRKDVIERTCPVCGDTHFSTKPKCRMCRERERHAARWKARKKLLDSQKRRA